MLCLSDGPGLDVGDDAVDAGGTVGCRGWLVISPLCYVGCRRSCNGMRRHFLLDEGALRPTPLYNLIYNLIITTSLFAGFTGRYNLIIRRIHRVYK